jgi:hypothetical protein
MAHHCILHLLSIGAASKLKYQVNSSISSSSGVRFKIGIVVAAVAGRWKEQALARNEGIFTMGFVGLTTVVGVSGVDVSR